MIRQTLPRTASATFLVRIPDPSQHDFPKPNGSGFFVSPDGHFITAHHVIKDVADVRKIQVTHHAQAGHMGPILKEPEVVATSDKFDLAVLKFDFARHSGQEWAKGRDGTFPFLHVDLGDHVEGTPVYSFGYPLPETKVEKKTDGGVSFTVGTDWVCPRTTSAIISSRWEVLGPVQTSAPSPFFALDKAFNYGNSGGPIVLQETGKAIGAVVRFQAVGVPQPGGKATVVIPSLYGIASSLRNWEAGFRKLGLWPEPPTEDSAPAVDKHTTVE